MIDSGRGTPDPHQALVRQLRTRAETAAEASVYHAGLAEQYLVLSRKLATLAENADMSRTDELRRMAAALDLTSTSDRDRTDGPDPLLSLWQHQALTGKRPAQFSNDKTTADTRTAKCWPDENSGTSDDASPTERRNTASRRVRSTRQQVERFRAARPAPTRQIRVKAEQADLKPRERKVTDELRQSRWPVVSSLALLTVSVFVLSLFTWQLEIESPLPPIICAFASDIDMQEPLQPVEIPLDETGEQTEQEVEDPVVEPEEIEQPTPETEVNLNDPINDKPSEMAEHETPDLPDLPMTTGSREAMSSGANAADNRSAAGRKALLKAYGGSQASESAVQRALEWLISIQHPDGYWDFVNVGSSGNAGSVNNPIGGTAYALLPFLAAGQTHEVGEYRKQVRAGLMYLTQIGVSVPAGYDLRGMINKGSDDRQPNEAYYVQGAAALALCEAYGMTHDRWLLRPARDAVKFIINSQDPRGGGWRYNPREPGSTSVTVVQVMALQAAVKAGIDVPESTFAAVHRYLDSVQVDGAGRYGYEIDRKRYTSAVTAMALLCRLYLGWGREDGDLRGGIALLDKAGPYDNLYSLYFGTQVMKNWGGEEWHRWNVRMRDDLVATQIADGPAGGSWTPRTGALHAKQGGRLLTTALATLTLQVYYRYQPLLPGEHPQPEAPR